jgi:hypothetical protein
LRRAVRAACRRSNTAERAGSAGGPKPGRAGFYLELGRRAHYDTRFFLDVSAVGIAEIAERKKLFTASAERNTLATSGSRTIATVAPSARRAANRFGRALE